MADTNHDADFSRKIGEFTLLESIVNRHIIPLELADLNMATLYRSLSNTNYLRDVARDCIVQPHEGNVTGDNISKLGALKEKYRIPSQIPNPRDISTEFCV